MVYKARLLFSGRQKIAAALLALLGIGFLMNYPRVTEAVLAFLLGGVVPGTNIIVSPDVVLLMVVCIFMAGIVGSIIRMYFKAARGKRNFRIAVRSIESVTVLPVARDMAIAVEPSAGIKVAAAVRKRNALRMFVSSSFRKFAHFLMIVSGTVGRILFMIGGASKVGIISVARAFWNIVRVSAEAIYTLLVLCWYGIENGVRWGGKALIFSARTAAKILRLLARRLVVFVHATWRSSVPRLQQADAWLEVQYRKIENRFAKAAANSHLLNSSPEYSSSSPTPEPTYRKSILTALRSENVLRSSRQRAVTIQPKVLTTPRGSRLKG